MFILWNRYQFYILQFRFGQILEWGGGEGVKLDTVGLFTLHFLHLFFSQTDTYHIKHTQHRKVKRKARRIPGENGNAGTTII